MARGEERIWTPERNQRLRDMWTKTPQPRLRDIARSFDSRASIVASRAQSMGLPTHPDSLTARRQQNRVEKHRPAPPPAPAPPQNPRLLRQYACTSDPPPAAPPPHRACQWPMGDPGRPGFRLCGAARIDGRRMPYCPEHYATATGRPQQDDKESADEAA